MNCRFILVGVLLVGLAVARAEGPDDMYVRIYYLIQEADNLSEKGEVRQAVVKYMEAQASLRNLKMVAPEWNEKVVNYRLNYITSKLDPLMQKLPQAELAPGAGAPGSAVSFQLATGGPLTNQIKALQEEIARLTAQNALLEAKLKEAWSVQPPATDPRELAKAEQKIKDVEKERDLLKVSLDQEKARSATLLDQSITAQERQILADVKQKLAQQLELTMALQQENQELKQQTQTLTQQTQDLQKQNQDLSQQLAELKLRSPTSGLAAGTGASLPAGQATLTSLQSSNIALRTELLLLESRLADVSKELVTTRNPKARTRELERELAAAKAAARELEQEKNRLQKTLDRVTNELARRGGSPSLPPASNLEKQLELARAQLGVYEARAVPYTAEELALIKQRELKATAVQNNTVKKKPAELPPGAGPLIAEAERAVDAGRFEEAERKYLQVLRQDERNVYTLVHLAAVQLDQDRLTDTEQTLQKALAVDPQDPGCLYLLGSLRYRQEKYEEALQALSLSAQLNPDLPQTQYYLGRTLMQRGQRQAAETALRRAIQLKPGWGDAHYLLAVVYATQQPPFKELAQWHYQKSLSGGAPRNLELEHLLDGRKSASAAP
jgi:tetratricopeptide (TPR) repeat protein